MSYHDDFKQGLDEDFRASPTSASAGVYWDALHKMNTGFFPRSYSDIVVQPSSRSFGSARRDEIGKPNTAADSSQTPVPTNGNVLPALPKKRSR